MSRRARERQPVKRMYLADAVRATGDCIGNDPYCPCQDGLACHYRDANDGTKAMPVPEWPGDDDVPLRDPRA